MNFEKFFETATGYKPFAFQEKFAHELPALVCIPTGLGKTAMAVLGWLWRRRSNEFRAKTPRRLVYCLPMRVLVEQTRDQVITWLYRLELLDGKATFDDRGKLFFYQPTMEDEKKISVHVLMGGEEFYDWDIYPERDMVLIGTQDMLLSRALNRGYAMSRARWPMGFGLLNTECLWIFDEIQLMGAGLSTSAQLEAYRRDLPGHSRNISKSIWMSATLDKKWLATIDFQSYLDETQQLELTTKDQSNKEVKKRWSAEKILVKSRASIGDSKKIAEEILNNHQKGKLTLVVVNTVQRAQELWQVLKKQMKNKSQSRLILLHSRFRPNDRKRIIEQVLSPPPPEGSIVVSTQVVEAGVDISASVLFTEIAPWASMVQRFGRCNRRGEEKEAFVYWIPLPADKKESYSKPYPIDELLDAEKNLKKIKNAGLHELAKFTSGFLKQPFHVIRRSEFIELFDTTPDLSGNDLDIDRFIRETENSDVQVFWRIFEEDPNDESSLEGPDKGELCPAPVHEVKDFVRKHYGKVWYWDFCENRWERASESDVLPGRIFLIHSYAGGYTSETGWNLKSQEEVEPVEVDNKGKNADSDENDFSSSIGGGRNGWQTIAEHTDDLVRKLSEMVQLIELDDVEKKALLHAARWHDRGKAHFVFQKRLPDGCPDPSQLWAKAAGAWKSKYERPNFRHELASALAVLDPRNKTIPEEIRDLVAYLVAAHHGKVRLTLRSFPNEIPPPAGNGKVRFARGIWDGDRLPETDLGGGVIAPEVFLSLEPMEMGLGEAAPFEGKPSWAERMIQLRDTLGAFRLAYLEAVLRAADMRASLEAQQKAKMTTAVEAGA